MPVSQKTVFLVVHSGFGARYLLRTDILRALKSAGVRIVILAPNADETYFRQEFEDKNVFIEKLEVEKCQQYRTQSKIQTFLLNTRYQTLSRGDESVTLRDRRRLFRQTHARESLKAKIVFGMMDLMVAGLSRSRSLRRLLLWVERKWFSGHFHRHLFEKYKPDMVITTSLGYFHPDDYVMREAKEHKALIVPVILSWDNTSTKGMAGAVHDYAIAWTEIMKCELVGYHDADPQRVFVGGIAHFDLYHRPGELMSRTELFQQMGLSPDQKLILFATKSPHAYPWNPDIVRVLAQAIEDGRIQEPCQLVVRLHPIHLRRREGELVFQSFLSEYETLRSKYPFVHIDVPKVRSEKLPLDMPWSDMVRLGSLLRHADVLVNMFSTVALEASIFDLPIVNVSFEGAPGRKGNPRHNIAMDEAQEHNQRVVKTGGAPVVHTPDGLMDQINRYLANRALDADGRLKIKERECGPNPGSAGKVIAAHLLELLERVTHP